MNQSGIEQNRVLPNTSWTLISAARGTGELSSKALNEFSRRYYQPIRSYISALCSDAEKTADLTQGFFTDVVASGRLLHGADQSLSFRPYLKQSLRNYVISEQRKWAAKKRIPDWALERPDAEPRGWDQFDLRSTAEAEIQFHTSWVRELLKAGLERFERLCHSKGQAQHFDLFTRHYLNPSGARTSWKELGDEFGVDQKVARSRAQTAAHHFGDVILSLLEEELGSPEEAKRELQTMIDLLVHMYG
jgi:DNA-directed RNA polymerase specialized sigma24 family protein